MVKDFRKMVATMSYRDMVDLSTMISESLPDCASPSDVAEVLINLPLDTADDQIVKTNDVLSRMFSRKKQITIQPHGENVFKIACPTVEGAVVFDNNIREGVSQLLDTLTVLQAFDDG